MKKYVVWGMLSLIGLSLWGQDTLLTNYPDTDQRWEKIYQDQQKVAENIYYTNGSPWMTVTYGQEKVENWKWYYENGNPYFFATILKDQLQGTYRIWYENGELAERLVFKDHLENGPASFFYEDGTLAAYGQYQEGKMIGEWRFFDEKGEPAQGAWEWRFAAALEKWRMKGKVVDGRPVGTWSYRHTASKRGVEQKKYQIVF